jgi:hypothetical protein
MEKMMKPSCCNCQHRQYQDIRKITWQFEPPEDYDCDLHVDLREICSDIGAIVDAGRVSTQAKREVIAGQCSEYIANL